MQIYPVQISYPQSFGGKIICVFQDKFGFIWIGKNTGLFRFDGNEVKVYRNDPQNTKSIAGNYVLSISDDASGDLWIGTKGNGLSRFHQKTNIFTNYVHDKDNPSSISHNELPAICPDGKGNFWIGTDGGGLNFFNRSAGKFTHLEASINSSKGLRSNNVIQIIPSGKGNYWISTWGGGLHHLNGDSKVIRRIGEGTRFEKINILAVKEVSPGILWLAAYEDGLLAYDIKKDKFSTVVPHDKHRYFKDINVTAKGEIYVGCHTGLLYFPNYKSSFEHIEGVVPGFKTIVEIFIDRTQSIWIGAADGLLGKINSFRKKFHTYRPVGQIQGGQVHAIVADKRLNTVYLASDNCIIEYNTALNVGKRFSTPSQLLSLVNIPNTHFLLGADAKQLLVFDTRTGRTEPLKFKDKSDQLKFKSNIRSVYCSGAGDFWVAAMSAAYQISFDLKSNTWSLKNSIPIGEKGGISESHYITSFLQNSSESLFIGAWGGGLNWRLPGSRDFKHLVHDPLKNKSISNNFVECISADNKGNIWIGTQGGLNKFNLQTSTVQSLSIADGLADDWIFAITVDAKNRVWTSTRRGISMVSQDLKTIRNYDITDGLPANEFLSRSVAVDNAGKIYFGSKNGLAWFFPDSISSNPFFAQPKIVDFEINGKRVEISASSALKQNIESVQEILLSHNQNTFAFKLASLSYFNPNRNQLKYKLEGFDKDWKIVKENPVALYSDVPPGTYTFSLLAANEDGLWNTKPKKINITIARPLWLSVWAYIFYSITLSGLVFYIFYKQRKSSQVRVATVGKVKVSEVVKPDQIQLSNVVSKPADIEFIEKAITIVEGKMSDPDFGVEALSDKMCLSQRQLNRRINSITGTPTSDFIKEIRLKKAAQLLLQKPGSISKVAFQVGFKDPKYFSKCFKQQFGVSPMHYSTENGRFSPLS